MNAMGNYIDATSFAVEKLINLINKTQTQYEQADDQLITATKEHAISKFVIGMNGKFNTVKIDTEDIAKSYFDTKALKRIREKKLIRILDKKHSINALSSALLQIAHQGIVSVHSNKNLCPVGKTIGTTNLRDLIWEARNQSMHYEDPSAYHPALVAMFSALNDLNSFGLPLEKKINYAGVIVSFLGWNSVESFKKDMLTLGAKKASRLL